MAHIERDEAIKRIREALRRRSGKGWSVRGGRGTAWGWIDVSSPPKRLAPEGFMTEAERAELGRLFGLELPVHHQGQSISPDERAFYVARAEGRGEGGPGPTPEGARDPAAPPSPVARDIEARAGIRPVGFEAANDAVRDADDRLLAIAPDTDPDEVRFAAIRYAKALAAATEAAEAEVPRLRLVKREVLTVPPAFPIWRPAAA